MWQTAAFFHPSTADKKPLLAISACLSGQAVRYDGTAKYQHSIAEWISPACQVQALCPEADAGLPTPRPPVQLVHNAGTIKALGREDQHLDVSEALQNYAKRRLDAFPNTLCGLILKSRSPSCGINSTPIYNNSGIQIDTRSGIFSHHAQIQRPWLAFAQESALQSKEQCLVYLWRLFINHDMLKARNKVVLHEIAEHYQRLLAPISSIRIENTQQSCRHLCRQVQQIFTEIDQGLAAGFVNGMLKKPWKL